MTSDSTDGDHCLSTSHIELYSQINREGTQTEQTHIITGTRCFLCTLSTVAWAEQGCASHTRPHQQARGK